MFSRGMPKITIGKLDSFKHITARERLEMERDRQKVRKILEVKKKMKVWFYLN